MDPNNADHQHFNLPPQTGGERFPPAWVPTRTGISIHHLRLKGRGVGVGGSVLPEAKRWGGGEKVLPKLGFHITSPLETKGRVGGVLSKPGLHLHVWQNDRELSCAAAVTRKWNGYRTKSQHRKFTPKKKLLLPLLRGLEPATFWSGVRHSNHWARPVSTATPLLPQQCSGYSHTSPVTALQWSQWHPSCHSTAVVTMTPFLSQHCSGHNDTPPVTALQWSQWHPSCHSTAVVTMTPLLSQHCSGHNDTPPVTALQWSQRHPSCHSTAGVTMTPLLSQHCSGHNDTPPVTALQWSQWHPSCHSTAVVSHTPPATVLQWSHPHPSCNSNAVVTATPLLSQQCSSHSHIPPVTAMQ